MAAETNLTNVEALGEVKSVDFASQFAANLNKFIEAMGVTRRQPMSIGSVIKQYKYDVSEAAGGHAIAEGDEIPLTKVERNLVRTLELEYAKHRKATGAESIQAHGYDVAINQTDEALMRHIQKEIRSDFFGFLADATADQDAINQPNLQGALAYGSAKVQEILDDDLTPIAFVNPNDAAAHLAEGNIVSSGSVFGLNLLSDYINARIFTNKDIPEGTVYVTAAENIVVAYVNPQGELSKAFPFTTDETGYIGVMHDIEHKRLTAETVTLNAIKFFPDVVNGVVAVTIGGGVEG